MRCLCSSVVFGGGVCVLSDTKCFDIYAFVFYFVFYSLSAMLIPLFSSQYFVVKPAMVTRQSQETEYMTRAKFGRLGMHRSAEPADLQV